MTTIHQFFAPLLALSGAALLAVIVVATATGRASRLATDRVILLIEGVVVLGAATGLVVLLTDHGPRDPLHLLYAAVALVVVPLARFWGRLGRRRRLALGVAAVLLAGLALRLAQTGGG